MGVLVVEDDRLVCDVMCDALQAAGFRTRCAQSDREAYGAFPALPKLQALVVDVNLGLGTTGFDVARVARRIHPNLVVVYVTGEVTDASFRAHGVPGSDFFRKPFAPDELVTKLQDRLAVSRSLDDDPHTVDDAQRDIRPPG